jgi:hypothetical protein
MSGTGPLYSNSHVHDMGKGGQEPMYTLLFKNMIEDLCQANPPSPPMLVQSLTMSLRDLVNAMHKVPLSSSS